jgi:glycosyltransferase involved in cell wall biosynthesis
MSFLHQQLWQRLPRDLRRSALFTASALAAPRPVSGTRPSYPIIVAGALRTASGLGESARLCHDALQAAGLPVLGVDLTADLMQPQSAPDFAFVDGQHHEGSGTLVLHVNSPLVPLAIWRLGRRLVRDKFIVGYWAWELLQLPPDWRHGIPFVHEIWTPSAFVAEAIRPISAERAVRVVPHAIKKPQSAPMPMKPSDRPFTVLTIFNMASSFARKNPLATIKAFRRAFGDDPETRLIVKTSNSSAFPPGLEMMKKLALSNENIVILEEAISRPEIDVLYDDCDVVISLHRSEGFGLTIAEAMMRGLPVVATHWSGNVDFCDSDVGMPIPYCLIPAEDPQDTYHHPEMHWADADIEAAAEALQRLRGDPGLRARLGSKATEVATRTFSTTRYAQVVRQSLGL